MPVDRCKCGCGRKRSRRHLLHETCKNRMWREGNPVGHAYKNLRTSAKKRGIVFTITLAEFRSLVEGTGYVENKGKFGDSLTIDRKDNSLGYEPGNLQVITRSENSAKYHVLDEFELARHGIHVNTGMEMPF